MKSLKSYLIKEDEDTSYILRKISGKNGYKFSFNDIIKLCKKYFDEYYIKYIASEIKYRHKYDDYKMKIDNSDIYGSICDFYNNNYKSDNDKIYSLLTDFDEIVEDKILEKMYKDLKKY